MITDENADIVVFNQEIKDYITNAFNSMSSKQIKKAFKEKNSFALKAFNGLELFFEKYHFGKRFLCDEEKSDVSITFNNILLIIKSYLKHSNLNDIILMCGIEGDVSTSSKPGSRKIYFKRNQFEWDKVKKCLISLFTHAFLLFSKNESSERVTEVLNQLSLEIEILK